MDSSTTRKLAAEAIGTFIFFFIGAGAIITNQFSKGGVGLLGIALAHGLILAIMISGLGHISGGHFNPAVTLAILVGRRISPALAGMYVVAQLVGGTLAGLALRLIFPENVWNPVHLGTPDVARDAAGVALVSFGQATLIEFFLTFFLVWAVYATAVDDRSSKIAGFGIGLTVAVDILVGGPLTGASMNPARTFGPALAAGYFPVEHLVYWIGPLLGGAAAGLLYTYLFLQTRDTPAPAPARELRNPPAKP